MRHTRMLLSALGAMLALLPSPVLGQARAVDVRVSAGYTYGLDDSPPDAWVVGGTVTVAEGVHSRFGVEVWHATMYGKYFSGQARARLVTALWEYEFSPGQRVNPYPVIGVGLTEYRDLIPELGGWETQGAPHVLGGLGVRWFLTQHVFVAPEARIGLVPSWYFLPYRWTVALGYAF